MSTVTQQTLKLLLAFAGIYIIWGTTFLAIAYGLRGFPPFLLSGLRFLIAGTLLLAWRYYKGERRYTWHNWKKNAVTGMLILGGGTGLVAWGEQYVQATEAAIAIATGPFWFIAIDRGNWRQYFSNKLIITGLLTGFAGLLLFLGSSIQSGSSGVHAFMRPLAFLVLALSSISWVLGSLYSKSKPADHSTILNIAQQLLVAGVLMILVSGITKEWQQFHVRLIPAASWAGLAFLVVFGSVIAYLSYIWLLSVKDPVLVSTHTYINPIVAVIAGWLIAGEGIASRQLLGLGIILTGVLLTNVSQYKPHRRVRVKLRRMQLFISRLGNPYPLKTHY